METIIFFFKVKKQQLSYRCVKLPTLQLQLSLASKNFLLLESKKCVYFMDTYIIFIHLPVCAGVTFLILLEALKSTDVLFSVLCSHIKHVCCVCSSSSPEDLYYRVFWSVRNISARLNSNVGAIYVISRTRDTYR